MLGILITAGQLLLALSLLIVLHEGGHFFFARLFKTRVEKFYLFFDFLFPFSNVLPFSLFKKKIGETQWGIGWFPLGGYVKIAGMVDESMDKEQLAKPPEPWEFRSKKAWQRLLIMLGGIIVNVLLAFLIYAMVLFVWGQDRMPLAEMKDGIMVTDSLGYKMGFKDGDKIMNVDGKSYKYFDEVLGEMPYAKQISVERNGSIQTIRMPVDWLGSMSQNGVIDYSVPIIIDSVLKGSGADKAGFQQNDIIVAVNGKNTKSGLVFLDEIKKHNKEIVDITVERNGQPLLLKTSVSDTGTIGINMFNKLKDFKRLGILNYESKQYGFFESFPAGVGLGVKKIKSYWRQLGLMFHVKNKAYKQTGGFISIAKVYGPVWDWQRFWSITAFMSIALAIMNLLPIPGLDGGYVVFTLIEMITGRKVNEKVLEIATTIGLVLLLALMVLVNGHDIFKLFK